MPRRSTRAPLMYGPGCAEHAKEGVQWPGIGHCDFCGANLCALHSFTHTCTQADRDADILEQTGKHDDSRL